MGNINITTQTGESFMRAELTPLGEKVVGLASNKKQAKATACQVICMLMGFYKPGATNTPPAPLADKLLPNSKQAQKRSLPVEPENEQITGGFQELTNSSEDEEENEEPQTKVQKTE